MTVLAAALVPLVPASRSSALARQVFVYPLEQVEVSAPNGDHLGMRLAGGAVEAPISGNAKVPVPKVGGMVLISLPPDTQGVRDAGPGPLPTWQGRPAVIMDTELLPNGDTTVAFFNVGTDTVTFRIENAGSKPLQAVLDDGTTRIPRRRPGVAPDAAARIRHRAVRQPQPDRQATADYGYPDPVLLSSCAPTDAALGFDLSTACGGKLVTFIWADLTVRSPAVWLEDGSGVTPIPVLNTRAHVTNGRRVRRSCSSRFKSSEERRR